MSQGESTTNNYGKFIAARIPEELKEEVWGFCTVREIPIQSFIRQAIREKLLRERGEIR